MNSNKNKKKILPVALTVFAILISSLLRAFSVHSFIIPNTFAPGGITGIASIIEIMSNGKINSGYILLIFNIPLLILAFKYLNWKFSAKTLASTVLASLLLIFLEPFEIWTGLNLKYVPQEKILAALAGGALGGGALAIMLKIGGSTGGTDIIAALVNKKNSAVSISNYIFMFDAVIVILSAVLFVSLDPIMLSIVEMFVGAKVSETVLNGLVSAVKFEIITDDPQKLSGIITKKINRGITGLTVTGMHTNTQHSLLICVVRKRQVSAMRNLLKIHAPNSFTYITQASEVIGKGFPPS